ncbi:hypothetical protein CW304_30680 [Bacillus sp. UFRGS-B20]|nr:hypothetical protein CW304_30680 [Bacillus sp. UFRGS-B20]
MELCIKKSRGEGNAPISPSESLGLKPNRNSRDKLEIKQGVKHFVKMYKYERKRCSWIQLIQAIIWGQGILILSASQKLNNTRGFRPKNSKMKVDSKSAMYIVVENKNNFRYHIVMVISNMHKVNENKTIGPLLEMYIALLNKFAEEI